MTRPALARRALPALLAAALLGGCATTAGKAAAAAPAPKDPVVARFTGGVQAARSGISSEERRFRRARTGSGEPSAGAARAPGETRAYLGA